MGLLSLTSEELRYKMKHLGVLCPNRSVANDEQFYELYSKFKDVIAVSYTHLTLPTTPYV